MQLKIHILPIRRLTEQVKDLKKMPAGTIGIIVCSDENNYPEELMKGDASLPACILSFLDTERREHPSAVKENHAEALKEYLSILFSANKLLSETNILPDNDKLNLYRDHAGTMDLFICCRMGQSRSPAIAAAILSAVGATDDIIFDNPYYQPNMLVYEMVCKAFGVVLTAEDLERKRQQSRTAFKKAKEMHGNTGRTRWEEIIIDGQMVSDDD